jgi:hypothetical protein
MIVLGVELRIVFQSGVPVIPLSVDNAPMPVRVELPESIRALADLQMLQIRRGADFQADVDRLIRAIELIAGANE